MDGIPPTMDDVIVVSDTELDVLFSEPVDPLTATLLSNYTVDNGIGSPSTAIVDGANPALVHLTFVTTFTNGLEYELGVVNIEDLDGNSILTPATESFLYFVAETAVLNDLIITELLADPNPVIGLPEREFIEIFNRSDKIFDLINWTVNDNSTTAIFGSYLIEPSEYVVICGPGDGLLYGISNYIEVDGLPTLNNSDDDLVLKDNTGLEIDSIHYFSSWYDDSDKADGGWTLERKHLNSPCSDYNNWGASVDPIGGTPGDQNSIWTDEDDLDSPYVVSKLINSETEVLVTFSEELDTLIELSLTISPTVASLSGEYLSLDTYQVNVLTLEPNEIYIILFEGGQDCWGNSIYDTIMFGMPDVVEPEDLILNEVMFNPLTGGSDYVELYNVSEKIIDLKQLYLANWDDTITNFSHVTELQRLLMPGEYVTLTEDSTDVIYDFAIYGVGSFVDMDLPTYPNDSGTVYLFRSDSVLIDFFHYDADFHYALLNSDDGKSLERITVGGGLNNPDNWHTASEFADWGTPGYLNSQYLLPNVVGDVSLDPQLFSPDSDGYNDVLSINFDLANTDNILDVSIYDNQGRLIRVVKDNYFIGQKGFVTWDGINDDGEKAAIGTYIVLVSVKNSEGDENLFKLVTVLGGQL